MNMERPLHALIGSVPGTIYLLRHGAVDSPGNGKRYIGCQDVVLSDLGYQQAHAWADRFSDTALETIYCSTLIRCLETARIIGQRNCLTPQALQELRELSLGAWEGRRIDTIKTSYPLAYQQRGDQISDYRPPGGESFRDLQQRVWPTFETVARRLQGRTLLVTHAGVIRVLLCHLLEIPLKNLFRIGQTYGALTIIEKGPQGYCVKAVNLQCKDPIFTENGY
jgi:probable phosphoglycerate mutase